MIPHHWRPVNDVAVIPATLTLVAAFVRTAMTFGDMRTLAHGKELLAPHQSILKAVGDGLYGLDRDGLMTFVKPRSGADDRPRDRGAARAKVARDGPPHQTRRHAHPVEFTSNPIVEGGTVKGAVVVFKDVTERREVEMRVGRAAADPLLRYMSAADGAPAGEALEVAAGIADARFLVAALELCGTADPRTRSLAATLAGSVGGSRAADALTGLLADPHAHVRAAAKALGTLAHWPATGTLAACLRDPSWDVRRAAAIALRAMGAVGVLLLRRALTERDRFARDMARQVLELPGCEQPAARDSRPRAVKELAPAS